MSKRVKVTIVSPSGTDYDSIINVKDDYTLPAIDGRDDWIELETEEGGMWAVPLRMVIAVVMEPPPEKKKRARRA